MWLVQVAGGGNRDILHPNATTLFFFLHFFYSLLLSLYISNTNIVQFGGRPEELAQERKYRLLVRR